MSIILSFNIVIFLLAYWPMNIKTINKKDSLVLHSEGSYLRKTWFRIFKSY